MPSYPKDDLKSKFTFFQNFCQFFITIQTCLKVYIPKKIYEIVVLVYFHTECFFHNKNEILPSWNNGRSMNNSSPINIFLPDIHAIIPCTVLYSDEGENSPAECSGAKWEGRGENNVLGD